jgi:hypothetical protein
MRKGWNPQKQKSKIDLHYRHRVIIVAYIPNNHSYYDKVLDVFKTCLSSLISTINSACAITVVNNGSNKNLINYLNEEFSNGRIDQVIHHNNNIGKMDALVGAARSSREELITITDTDILFTTGWQEAVENVFDKFPKAGSVSPIPVQSNALFYNTNTVLKDIVLKKLKYSLETIPENFEPHNRYLESINWEIKNNKNILWPVVESGRCKAIVGSGHQVMTLRKEIFLKHVSTVPSRTLVGGNSEYLYGDEPTDKAGFYRLATYHNFAYHMGNTLESWMTNILANNTKQKTNIIRKFNFQIDYNDNQVNNIRYKIKKRVFKKLFKLLFSYKLD